MSMKQESKDDIILVGNSNSMATTTPRSSTTFDKGNDGHADADSQNESSLKNALLESKMENQELRAKIEIQELRAKMENQELRAKIEIQELRTNMGNAGNAKLANDEITRKFDQLAASINENNEQIVTMNTKIEQLAPKCASVDKFQHEIVELKAENRALLKKMKDAEEKAKTAKNALKETIELAMDQVAHLAKEISAIKQQQREQQQQHLPSIKKSGQEAKLPTKKQPTKKMVIEEDKSDDEDEYGMPEGIAGTSKAAVTAMEATVGNCRKSVRNIQKSKAKKPRY